MFTLKGSTQTLKHVLAGSALLGLSAISQSAFALDATVTGFAYTGPDTVHIASTTPAVTEYVYAGGFAGTYADSTSFIGYCADIAQFLAPWNASTSYTSGSLASTFGSTKADDLATLGNKFYSFVNNADTSAAFQIATWEILFETGSSYNLSANSFTATGGTASTAALGLAQTWLDGLSTSAVTGNYNLSFIQSSGYQDLVVFTAAVPEPESYAMMLAGLGLMGFVASRRKSS